MERNGPEVFGCDVDGEAVAWCNANLRAGHFTTIDPFPPTPYADASFDLVAGYSIFTHLTQEVQFAWLAEIRRILAPGGIFVATVHGDFVSEVTFPGKVASVLKSGIYDERPRRYPGRHRAEGLLPGHFPDGRVHAAQVEQYFDILEYNVRGIGNHQDVVVMRRPA